MQYQETPAYEADGRKGDCANGQTINDAKVFRLALPECKQACDNNAECKMIVHAAKGVLNDSEQCRLCKDENTRKNDGFTVYKKKLVHIIDFYFFLKVDVIGLAT